MRVRSAAGVLLLALFLPSLRTPGAGVTATPATGVQTTTLTASLVASGFTNPVGFVQDPTNPAVQYVVEQGGRIRVLVDGQVQPTSFLDLTGQVSSTGERGLLGLAFAPDYASSGRLFVNFTNLDGHTVVARFTRSPSNPLLADPASRFDLAWPGGQRFIVQPFPNHNGGQIAFGPDGFLYVGMGDGGSADDPDHRAQDPSTLLGKMLRLDVSVSDSDPEGYDVPPGNPFVGNADVLDEIWAFGLRNPWRWSFDDPASGGTGALVIADVGQGLWEEINYEPPATGGRNYGWRNREGAHDHIAMPPPFAAPLVDPIHEYPHSDGRSITGGFIYRGSALPDFVGRYFFADYVTSRFWSLGLAIDGSGEATVTDVQEHTGELAGITSPSSFGVDAAGELYVVSHDGAVYRLGSPVAPPPTDSCTTIRPGDDWTCHNGGWLPPGITPPPSSPPPTTPPPSIPPPSTDDCTTIRPGDDWTCYNGGWLPPGMTPPPDSPPPATPPPSTDDCTTPRPGDDWTCRNGGWFPPGHPGGI